MSARLSRAGLALLASLLCAAASSAQAANSLPLRLHAEGRHEESRVAALALIGTGSTDPDAYVALSLSLLALGRPADAELYARRGLALRKDPRLAEALGEAVFALGRNEEALRHLQTYIAASPEGGRAGIAFYTMGEAYLRLGRWWHADIALTAALQYSPGSAAWWARLGYARERAGDAHNALIAYERALSLDPRLSDAALGRERLAARLRG